LPPRARTTEEQALDLERDLARLDEQERLLRLRDFDLTTAGELGARLREAEVQRGVAIAMEVRLQRETVFCCAMPGTTPESADWARRKRNTVELMQKRSHAVSRELERDNTSLEQKMGLALRDYTQRCAASPQMNSRRWRNRSATNRRAIQSSHPSTSWRKSSPTPRIGRSARSAVHGIERGRGRAQVVVHQPEFPTVDGVDGAAAPRVDRERGPGRCMPQQARQLRCADERRLRAADVIVTAQAGADRVACVTTPSSC
jgi:uncharacterized protein (UPF0303 family)